MIFFIYLYIFLYLKNIEVNYFDPGPCAYSRVVNTNGNPPYVVGNTRAKKNHLNLKKKMDMGRYGDIWAGEHGHERTAMIHHRIGKAVVVEGYFRRNAVSRITAPPTPPLSR